MTGERSPSRILILVTLEGLGASFLTEDRLEAVKGEPDASLAVGGSFGFRGALLDRPWGLAGCARGGPRLVPLALRPGTFWKVAGTDALLVTTTSSSVRSITTGSMSRCLGALTSEMPPLADGQGDEADWWTGGNGESGTGW